MIVEQFDEMIEECERRPLVFAVALHPFIFGQPHRIRPLRKALQHCFANKLMDRVWKCRPGEIADYCLKLAPGIIPGS